MRRSKFIIGLTATALVLPLGAFSATATEVAPADATAWTEWVSDDGGSAGRELPAVSSNGRYVVFVGRSDAFGGVWVKDRKFPLRPAVQVASGFLFNPDISADGSTVVWAQYGSKGSGGQQVYLKKWRDPFAVPILVSRGDDGEPAQAVTDFPSVSGNGRYVAFQSMDMTLDDDALPGKAGGNRTKAYVRDMVLGETEMVSVVGTNTIPNGSGIKPDITPDGRYVAFASDSTDLQGIESDEEGEEETTTYQQVYRRDRVAKTTIPVSVASDDVTFGDGGSSTVSGPSISDNGARVAFESMADNLVAGDTNLDIDVFVRRIPAGVTSRVSVDENGAQFDTDDTGDTEPGDVPDDPDTPDDESTATVDALPVGQTPAINGKGGFVAFQSMAPLMAEDENGVADIYRFGLVDSTAPGLTRWSVVDDLDDPLAFEASGTRIDGNSGEEVVASNGSDPAIAADGSRVVFVSQGNLTGRVVEEEEGEEPSAEPTEVTAIEPNVYLHRPNPEPDIVAPRSHAYSPYAVSRSPIRVTYSRSDPIFPSSGVVAVRLYVKKPGWTKYRWVQTDRGDAIDRIFKVTALRDGKYRFYTRARDAQGNLEAAPARADDVTIKR